MKKILRFAAVVAMLGGVLSTVGCQKIYDDIDQLKEKVSKIEGTDLTALVNKVDNLATEITNVKTAYVKADAELLVKIKAIEAAYAKADGDLKKELGDSLDAEINARKDLAKKLDDDIETLRGELSKAVTDLTNAYTAADLKLAGDIEAAKTFATGKDAALRSELVTMILNGDEDVKKSLTEAFKAADEKIIEAYKNADGEVIKAYIAADVVLSKAYQDADALVTKGYQSADSLLTIAYKAEDGILKTLIEKVEREYKAADTEILGQISENAREISGLKAADQGILTRLALLEGRVKSDSIYFAGQIAALDAAYKLADAEIRKDFNVKDSLLEVQFKAADAAIRAEFKDQDSLLNVKIGALATALADQKVELLDSLSKKVSEIATKHNTDITNVTSGYISAIADAKSQLENRILVVADSVLTKAKGYTDAEITKLRNELLQQGSELGNTIAGLQSKISTVAERIQMIAGVPSSQSFNILYNTELGHDMAWFDQIFYVTPAKAAEKITKENATLILHGSSNTAQQPFGPIAIDTISVSSSLATDAACVRVSAHYPYSELKGFIGVASGKKGAGSVLNALTEGVISRSLLVALNVKEDKGTALETNIMSDFIETFNPIVYKASYLWSTPDVTADTLKNQGFNDCKTPYNKEFNRAVYSYSTLAIKVKVSTTTKDTIISLADFAKKYLYKTYADLNPQLAFSTKTVGVPAELLFVNHLKDNETAQASTKLEEGEKVALGTKVYFSQYKEGVSLDEFNPYVGYTGSSMFKAWVLGKETPLVGITGNVKIDYAADVVDTINVAQPFIWNFKDKYTSPATYQIKDVTHRIKLNDSADKYKLFLSRFDGATELNQDTTTAHAGKRRIVWAGDTVWNSVGAVNVDLADSTLWMGGFATTGPNHYADSVRKVSMRVMFRNNNINYDYTINFNIAALDTKRDTIKLEKELDMYYDNSDFDFTLSKSMFPEFKTTIPEYAGLTAADTTDLYASIDALQAAGIKPVDMGWEGYLSEISSVKKVHFTCSSKEYGTDYVYNYSVTPSYGITYPVQLTIKTKANKAELNFIDNAYIDPATGIAKVQAKWVDHTPSGDKPYNKVYQLSDINLKDLVKADSLCAFETYEMKFSTVATGTTKDADATDVEGTTGKLADNNNVAWGTYEYRTFKMAVDLYAKGNGEKLDSDTITFTTKDPITNFSTAKDIVLERTNNYETLYSDKIWKGAQIGAITTQAIVPPTNIVNTYKGIDDLGTAMIGLNADGDYGVHNHQTYWQQSGSALVFNQNDVQIKVEKTSNWIINGVKGSYDEYEANNVLKFMGTTDPAETSGTIAVTGTAQGADLKSDIEIKIPAYLKYQYMYDNAADTNVWRDTIIVKIVQK